MWNTPGYKSVLSRSSSITCIKFETQYDELTKKVDSILKANKKIDVELLEVMEFCKKNNILQEELFNEENPQNPLVVKIQDSLLRIKKEKDALPIIIAEAFSEIEELMVKEKGYLLQNKMFQKRTGYDFLKTSELRKSFYSKISKRYGMFETRYNRFNEEIKSWKIYNILNDIFSTYK